LLQKAEKVNPSSVKVKFDKISRPVSVLSVDRYRRLFPDDYVMAIKDTDVRGEPAVNFAMEVRAAAFRAANIVKVAVVPPDLLERFNQVADAAVGRREASALADALDPSINTAILGRFAAVLLKRDFQIVGYQAIAGDANTSAITAEFHPLETGSDTRKVTIQLRRVASDAPWRMAGIDIATK
jgi:hypothetical protein